MLSARSTICYYVSELEPPDWSDRVVDHRLAPFRRRSQRRLDRVPDQPGALPAHPLPARHLRAHHLRCAAGRGRINRVWLYHQGAVYHQGGGVHVPERFRERALKYWEGAGLASG